MLSKELFNWFRFSRLESKITEKSKKNIKNKGIAIIIDKDWKVNNKYTNKNIKDLINTAFLKTAIMDKECLTRFKKLILDGPKYLKPLIDGIETRSLNSLVNEPEKLLQVEAFSNIWETTNLGKHV